MKITDRCPNTAKTFGELKIGDVFCGENDREIMMKLGPFNCDDQTNCVSLEDGEGYSYKENYRAILIPNVELIIN